MVRDEFDVIRANVLHSLSLGLDGLLVVDNGSSDGTTKELELLGRDKRVRWTRDESPFKESEILTGLAHEATRAGAEWVFKIDADEFWTCPRRPLKQVLRTSTAASLAVKGVNFIQRREQTERSAEALLHMTRRTPAPVANQISRPLVLSRQIANVEIDHLAKMVTRTSPDMIIGRGSHFVLNVPGDRAPTDEIICLHAPLRARSVLDKKAMHGRRVEEVGFVGTESWHLRRWRQLRDEGLLDDEWAANSYAGDALDVYGRRHAVVFDPTLRDLVIRWFEPSLVRRIVGPGKE